MKVIRIALTIGLLTFTAVLAAEENVEYEYEDSEAAVPPASPAPRNRSPLLSSRPAKPSPLTVGNSKINRLPAAAAKPAAAKSSTTTAAPQEEPQEPAGENEEGEDAVEEQSPTEPPKRTIKPVVRPFRSNDDLLAALKRRRQQVQNTGAVVDRTSSSTTTTTPSSQANKKSSNAFGSNAGRRRGGNAAPKPSQPPASDVSAESEPVKKTPSRKYNSRANTRPSPAPVVEEVKPAEEQTKPKFGRGSRRPTAS